VVQRVPCGEEQLDMAEERNRYSFGCSCLPVFAGSVAAICVSWVFNHSVLWCILHAIFGWFYVGFKTVWYVVNNY